MRMTESWAERAHPGFCARCPDRESQLSIKGKIRPLQVDRIRQPQLARRTCLSQAPARLVCTVGGDGCCRPWAGGRVQPAGRSGRRQRTGDRTCPSPRHSHTPVLIRGRCAASVSLPPGLAYRPCWFRTPLTPQPSAQRPPVPGPPRACRVRLPAGPCPATSPPCRGRTRPRSAGSPRLSRPMPPVVDVGARLSDINAKNLSRLLTCPVYP